MVSKNRTTSLNHEEIRFTTDSSVSQATGGAVAGIRKIDPRVGVTRRGRGLNGTPITDSDDSAARGSCSTNGQTGRGFGRLRTDPHRARAAEVEVMHAGTGSTEFLTFTVPERLHG